MLEVILWVLLHLLLFGLGFIMGRSHRKLRTASRVKYELHLCSPSEYACKLCCLSPVDCKSVCCSYARRMYSAEFCNANWMSFYLTKI